MDALSVIIITYNEAPHIAACLESVAWADEIIIVDCGSTDGTPGICRNYTDQVYSEARFGSGLQKQQALDKARFPWILNIDADEKASMELRQDIKSIQENGTSFDGFCIPRRNYFLTRQINHAGWGDDRPLRLFRRTKTRVTDTQVHEGFIVEGAIDNLNSPLIHNAYVSLFQYFEKLNEYTSIEVRNRLRANADRRISWVHFTLAPLGAFWKLYVVKKGFLDGLHGLLLCLLSAVSVMTGYAKIWEYQLRHRQGHQLFPPIRTEEITSRQPGYNRLIEGGDEEFDWKDK